jgi:hypothetical protein
MSAGPQVVVLVTDGDPNTGTALFMPTLTDYAPSIAAAMKLQQKHLWMSVIGVGDDAAKMHLQQMANLGAGLAQAASPGATVHYPPDPAALIDALKMVIGKEVSFDVELSGKGVIAGSECKGSVTLDGDELRCNGADGWVLEDATHIRLQGRACVMLKKAADATLNVSFPCDALIQ